MFPCWRDCEEWKKQGLDLTTCSSEAAKLFDAAVNQYVLFYDDEEHGGIEGTFGSMKTADPEFVMGYVIQNGLQLLSMSSRPSADAALRQGLNEMERLASKQLLNPREQLHVKAIKLLENGFLDEACFVWENILIDHPHDVLAVRFAQDGYIHLGQPAQIRDCIARILPDWNISLPLYGSLLGMYSFGLCETRNYELAEKMAQKSLEMNKNDGWSTHALAHVLEMTGRPEEGIEFLQSTADAWQDRSWLSCHLNWHSAIFHIEKGDHKTALNMFDEKINPLAKKEGGAFNISDASSLLFRLSLEDYDVGNRWHDLFTLSQHHVDDHVSLFYDLHYLISSLGAKQTQVVDDFLKSSYDFISVGQGSNQRVMHRIARPLFEALIAFNDGQYELAVEKLLPIKYEVTDGLLSGSRAQKDMIMLLLIRATLKSSVPRHRILARRLLAERKALKERSPLTDRLIAHLKVIG